MRLFSLLLAIAISCVPSLSVAGQNDTLEQIRETGKLRIGFRENQPPMSFVDNDGRPTGFSVDLCTHIADEVKGALGKDDIAVEFVPVSSSDRFDALVSHAGLFNLTSMYGATEELWFPEWEFGGPPWEDRTYYEQWSPHRFAQNFRTPTLVIHGALDYRVPDTEGLQMFTALRRQGVPARLVYFPDEGHWVGRPQNRLVWWTEVHAWLARYLGGDAPVP